MPPTRPSPGNHRPHVDRYKDHVCAARGCHYTTRTWSRYCSSHARRLRLHGHPEAKPLSDRAHVHLTVLTGRILIRNADHPGLKLAYGELQGLLNDASAAAECSERSGKVDPVASLWSAVAAAGCSPWHVMAATCAAVLNELHYTKAPSQRAYVASVGRAVLMLATKRKTKPAVSASTLHRVGSFLLDRYGTIASGVVDAVTKEEEQSRGRHAAMRAPLK